MRYSRVSETRNFKRSTNAALRGTCPLLESETESRSRLQTHSVHGIIDFTFTENRPKANRTVCNLHTQTEATRNETLSTQITRSKVFICTSRSALTTNKRFCSWHKSQHLLLNFSATIGHLRAVHVTNAQECTR